MPACAATASWMRGTRWFRLPLPKSGHGSPALFSQGFTTSEYDVLMTSPGHSIRWQARMMLRMNITDSGLHRP